jgi:hypothetical protein
MACDLSALVRALDVAQLREEVIDAYPLGIGMALA